MGATAENPTKAARRDEILDAAFEEFSQHGYAGASMAAIARRARASKETLYAWFENKETLFNTLFAARMDRITSNVEAAAARDPSPAGVLSALAEDLMRFMLAVEPFSRAMGGGQASEAALRLIGQTIAERRARFVDYILQCRANGDIDFDDDPFELVSLFVAMAEGEWSLRLATGMLDELTDEMIATHARRVTRIFLKGLAPEGPRR
jgi:AcrR family transcriptional regulator